MSLLMLKTKNLSWQDHTLNIEVMLAPLRSTLLLNKHKTLDTKFDKEKALYQRQRDACIKDYVVETRLIERRRQKILNRKRELQAEARAKSALESAQQQQERSEQQSNLGRSSSAPVDGRATRADGQKVDEDFHPTLPRLGLKHTPLFAGNRLRPKLFLETGPSTAPSSESDAQSQPEYAAAAAATSASNRKQINASSGAISTFLTGDGQLVRHAATSPSTPRRRAKANNYNYNNNNNHVTSSSNRRRTVAAAGGGGGRGRGGDKSPKRTQLPPPTITKTSASPSLKHTTPTPTPPLPPSPLSKTRTSPAPTAITSAGAMAVQPRADRGVPRRVPNVTFLEFLNNNNDNSNNNDNDDDDDDNFEDDIRVEVKPKTVEDKVRDFLRELDSFNSRPATACSSIANDGSSSISIFSSSRSRAESERTKLVANRYQNLSLDRKLLEKAFDRYCEKGERQEDLLKAMKLASKMKAHIRQARNTSLVPTMATFKSSRTFMKLLKRQQRRDMQQEQQQQQQQQQHEQ